MTVADADRLIDCPTCKGTGHLFTGAHLRLARTEAELTLAEAGAAVGLSPQYIYQLEAGQRGTIRRDLADRILEAYRKRGQAVKAASEERRRNFAARGGMA